MEVCVSVRVEVKEGSGVGVKVKVGSGVSVRRTMRVGVSVIVGGGSIDKTIAPMIAAPTITASPLTTTPATIMPAPKPESGLGFGVGGGTTRKSKLC